MTPHDINILDEEEKVVRTYPPSGGMIRLGVKTRKLTPLPDGTHRTATVYGEPVGLPEWKAGVVYIVSALVKQALPLREDLLVPAEVVRDSGGNIIGCKSLGA